MIRGGLLAGLLLIAVFMGGCTGSNQDENFKGLVKTVADDFKDQKDLIGKPTQGLTVTQLNRYRSAASSAISTAQAMTLSDKFGKAREGFITGMNATITAVDTLEKEGKLTSQAERITTESVNGYFITTQTKIDDTCDLIGIKKEKSF